MRKKIFILGVGAQKAGTTWLHSQLSSNSNIDMGIIKEYHVFDTIFVESKQGPRTKIVTRVLAKNDRGELGKNITRGKNDENLALRLSFIDNTENYFNHFDYLHLRNSSIDAVGDITPSYSMLDSKAHQHIKKGLETRGFTVKVIFLMRDPVERLWSLSRMMKRNAKNMTPIKTKNINLDRVYKNADFEALTRYESTIKELESVYDKGNIYYGFYENLFTEDSFLSIRRFLEVDINTPDYDFKINESPKSTQIDNGLAQKVAQRYEDTYRIISNKFGEDIKEIWTGYKYI